MAQDSTWIYQSALLFSAVLFLITIGWMHLSVKGEEIEDWEEVRQRIEKEARDDDLGL